MSKTTKTVELKPGQLVVLSTDGKTTYTIDASTVDFRFTKAGKWEYTVTSDAPGLLTAAAAERTEAEREHADDVQRLLVAAANAEIGGIAGQVREVIAEFNNAHAAKAAKSKPKNTVVISIVSKPEEFAAGMRGDTPKPKD